MNRRASVNYFSAISTAFLHYYPDHQGPRPWHVTLPRQRGPLHRRDQRLWNDINNSKNTKASQQWIEVANSRCSLVSLPSFYGLIVGLVLGQQPWFMEMLELGVFEELLLKDAEAHLALNSCAISFGDWAEMARIPSISSFGASLRDKLDPTKINNDKNSFPFISAEKIQCLYSYCKTVRWKTHLNRGTEIY